MHWNKKTKKNFAVTLSSSEHEPGASALVLTQLFTTLKNEMDQKTEREKSHTHTQHKMKGKNRNIENKTREEGDTITGIVFEKCMRRLM